MLKINKLSTLKTESIHSSNKNSESDQKVNLTIALSQMKMSNILADNLHYTVESIKDAAQQGAKLVVFPEVQLSNFFPQYRNLNKDQYALSINSPSIKAIQNACRQHKIYAVPNFYLKEGSHYYDASPMIDDKGDILGISKMVHIAQASHFYEQDYYTPSDSGFHVYNTPIGKIGIVICFDRHLPESIRSCALQGAEIIVIPTANTKQEPMELFECEVRVQAMQNQVYIAMCNRVGQEDQMTFAGESLFVDPSGQIISKAEDKPCLLTAELNLSKLKKARQNLNYLKLRRAELYNVTSII